MSMELDMAYVQEATELVEDDWEFITTRLRNDVMPYQQILADANPNVPYHWLKQRCDRGQCEMVHTKHTDNPTLYVNGELTPKGAAYMRKLSALTGVRRLRLEKGLWVAAEGLVYEDFDPAVHLINRFEIPQSWPRYWVVDFGYTNPFVCQWWAEDPDGRLYLYREIYMTKRLVEDHARQMLKCVISQSGPRKGQWKEPRPYQIICDHDAEDRATLEKHLDLGTSAAHKPVSDGVQATQSRFKIQPDGKPRIYILRDSLVERDHALEDVKKPFSTEQEIEGYVWPPSKEGSENKEAPLKLNDHGMDCMRYMVAEKDVRGGFAVYSL
jgi:phage terminase large subunit